MIEKQLYDTYPMALNLMLVFEETASRKEDKDINKERVQDIKSRLY